MHLPPQLTSFVGRAELVAALADQLHRRRLVTITGPGGAGKTRLALRTATNVAGRLVQEVWFVELADVMQSEQVGDAAAAVVGAPQEPGVPKGHRLAGLIRDRAALLVLDNCEHVLDGTAALVADLLGRCPRLRVLTTSRRPMAVPGEVVWNVLGLDLPEDEADAAPDELRASEAVQLFLDRAATADPQHQVVADESDLQAVARICRRVDGLPLAIELAAARTRTLTLDDLEHQLDDPFHLLTEGARTAPRRQRTLEAAVAWSYELLDDDERRLFERLGVFRGPVDGAAVAAVCADDEQDEAAIVALLSALVDQSMVVADREGSSTTYRQLDTLRSYARRQLARGGAQQGVHEAHGIAKELGDESAGEGLALLFLMALAARSGSQRDVAEVSSRACAAHGLLAGAWLLVRAGRLEEAAEIVGISQAIRERLDLPVPDYDLVVLEPLNAEPGGRLVEGRRDEPVLPSAERTEYRVLGPLQASRGDRPLDLGSLKQRKVLLRLLLAEGDPVSVDQLVDAVWDTDPPGKPRASLQAYVSRLRHVLGADGQDAIVRFGSGYAVDLSHSDVDLCRAEQRLASSRSDEDPERVAEDCAQGLAQWRGRPADELGDLLVATTFRRRADHINRQLSRERARALLDLGRNQQAARELIPALQRHVYDEELQAMLLQALHRQGCRGEALATHERFRRRLAEDVGVNPSAKLRDIHAQLLEHAPA